jgi:NAD(P)-dependent dehydrogenase (short-subunit alcohol dehydrogenase family)
MIVAGNAGNGRLAGRHVIITGAASGIGKATAELFHSEGAKLALIDRDGDKVMEVAEVLGAYPIPLDLAELAEIAPAVERAAEAMGGLDGLVNCAAAPDGTMIENVDIPMLTKVASVNFMAPVMLCAATVPHMRKAGKGTIVNIASGQGVLPNAPGTTLYGGTKGGLIAFTKSLAFEVAPVIRANAICPGLTNTPMGARLFAGWNGEPADNPALKAYALKRMAEPIEQAQAILFLTSDESSYVTGVLLAVDGGRCFH